MSDSDTPPKAHIIAPSNAATTSSLLDALAGSILSSAEARQLIAAGRLMEQARALVQQAHDEAEAIRQRARQEGYEAGMSEATEALVKARSEHSALLDRSEGDLVSLAIELTRTLIGHRLEVEPELMVKLTARTLELARGHRSVELHVHPDDAPLALKHTDALREIAATPALYIVEDSQVPRSGCRIETEAGIIEADLETQLELLARHLGVELWALRGRSHNG